MNLASNSLIFIKKKELVFAGLSVGYKTLIKEKRWNETAELEHQPHKTFVFKWDFDTQTSIKETCLYTNDEILNSTMQNYISRTDFSDEVMDPEYAVLASNSDEIKQKFKIYPIDNVPTFDYRMKTEAFVKEKPLK